MMNFCTPDRNLDHHETVSKKFPGINDSAKSPSGFMSKR
jgi:hypothetical protein